jgi:hypothetical protein
MQTVPRDKDVNQQYMVHLQNTDLFPQQILILTVKFGNHWVQ